MEMGGESRLGERARLMEAYQLLRRGGTLTAAQIDRLPLRLPAHQAAALAHLLWVKSSPSNDELGLFLRVVTAIPATARVLSALGSDQPAARVLDASLLGILEGHEKILLRVLKNSHAHSHIGAELVKWLIDTFVVGNLPAELMTIWLSQVCQSGLSPEDTEALTLAMRDSGRCFDYRRAPELGAARLVRRYPTGALSEKVALILPSLIAAVRDDVPVASPFLVAKSLGFTGGTWSKLSAIPGFTFPLPGAATLAVLEVCGVAMVVAQEEIDPADRMLFELRSATGTVVSPALIAASIASKHLAVPVDRLLLDVRYGPGAFITTRRQAKELGYMLLDILNRGGVPTLAAYNEALQPTGMAIGNALEVIEALAVMGLAVAPWNSAALSEQRDLVIEFFATLMEAEFGRTLAEWRERAESLFAGGAALGAFFRVLEAHGVERQTTDMLRANPWTVLLQGTRRIDLIANSVGHVAQMDQVGIGNFVNFTLGAGGNDYAGEFSAKAGIVLAKRLGDSVRRGELLCTVYSDASVNAEEIDDGLHKFFVIE